MFHSSHKFLTAASHEKEQNRALLVEGTTQNIAQSFIISGRIIRSLKHTKITCKWSAVGRRRINKRFTGIFLLERTFGDFFIHWKRLWLFKCVFRNHGLEEQNNRLDLSTSPQIRVEVVTSWQKVCTHLLSTWLVTVPYVILLSYHLKSSNWNHDSESTRRVKTS